MGASTSSEDTGEVGLTLEGLIEEANRVLVKATEVITQTVESEMGDMMSDLQERAAAKMGATFATIQEKLAELSRQSEEAQACVQRKEAEFQGVQVKMKNAMLECYSKHNDALERLRPERTIIHTEAKQFKLEAQKIIENCMTSPNRLECFRAGLAELAGKTNVLLKKFEALVKHETEIRNKSMRQFLECDKRAIDEANKSFNRIIDEIKKCGQTSINKNLPTI